MDKVRFATLNLYHFAAPGIFWHERKDTATHTADSWKAKKDWLAAMIGELGADIIAFQEVVSVDELRYLCHELGYGHFHCLTPPHFDDDDQAVYTNATVAIAARFSAMDVDAITGFGDLIGKTVLDSSAQFSRPPLRCVFDLPGMGETVVYAAHFKSQGAFVDDDEIDAIADWDQKFRAFYTKRSHGGVDQVARRAGEAAAMYHRFRHDLAHDPERPVILLGDLNEGPASHTLSILTQSDMVLEIGSVHYSQIPEEFRHLKHVHRLYDAYTLVPNAEMTRPITHSGWGEGETLDYAIVSNGLNPRNPRRRATVVRHEVWSDHFREGTEKAVSSDHAPVMVTVEPRGDA